MARYTRAELQTAAKELLVLADRDPAHQAGDEIAFVRWRREIHLCRLQRPYPEKPYIVATTKVAAHMFPGLTTAVRSQRRLPVYKAHHGLEFAGRRYLLGLHSQTLLLLSGEDMVYCLLHPTSVTTIKYRLSGELIDFRT